MSKENWRPVIGYERIYEVSNHGNVRRVKYFDAASQSHHGNNLFKPMKQGRDGGGYFKIKLMNHGKPNTKHIHRLVAEAFIPNHNNLPCINHKDGNKENNKVSNLEWCTHKQNNAHAYANKMRVMKNKKGSMPVGMFDKETKKLLRTFPSTHEASRQTGFAQSHIWETCAKKNKSAYGYIWKYI